MPMSPFSPEDKASTCGLRPRDNEARILDSEVLLQKAFEEDEKRGCAMLFRLYYAQLFSHALRFAYSKPVAEDIVADVFCRFWEDRIFERITTSYRAYLFQAVRHRAYNYVKFELAKKSRSERVNSAHGSSMPDEILQYDELYQFLEGTINRLPSQCKRVFVLSRIENKRYQDIALELGISVKAIEGHISRALRVLRKQLVNNCDLL